MLGVMLSVSCTTKAIKHWLLEHFQNYRKREPWSFCWRVTLEYLVVGCFFAFVAWAVGLPEQVLKGSRLDYIQAGLVTAPMIETSLFQAIPIAIARSRNLGFSSQVLWSTVTFTVVHFTFAGAGTGLVAGLVGGFYLAFTYAHWRNRSWWTAMWTTALSHAMANGIILGAAIASGEI